MNRSSRILTSAQLSLLLWLGIAPAARAQQAIVTMPSADITERGDRFAMVESQLRLWGPRREWNNTLFFTYGLGWHTELAVTFFNVGHPPTGEASVSAGFKSAIPLLPRLAPQLELKLTVGFMGFASLQGKGMGHWLYGHLSLRLPRLQTRLSAGVSTGDEILFLKPNAHSFIGSIEQPLPWLHGLTLTAEWFSGSHDLSNLIVGAAYHHQHSRRVSAIYVLGYKIPTKDRLLTSAEQALVMELGLFWR